MYRKSCIVQEMKISGYTQAKFSPHQSLHNRLAFSTPITQMYTTHLPLTAVWGRCPSGLHGNTHTSSILGATGGGQGHREEGQRKQEDGEKRWSQKWDRMSQEGNTLLFPECVGCVKLIGSMLGEYGKAGNGNKTETGNGNWKRKPETENRNGNATSSLL